MILTNLLLLEECVLILRPLYTECESVMFYNLCPNFFRQSFLFQGSKKTLMFIDMFKTISLKQLRHN